MTWPLELLMYLPQELSDFVKIIITEQPVGVIKRVSQDELGQQLCRSGIWEDLKRIGAFSNLFSQRTHPLHQADALVGPVFHEHRLGPQSKTWLSIFLDHIQVRHHDAANTL
jgi:hypothetical protein